jgi:hypothetical protein
MDAVGSDVDDKEAATKVVVIRWRRGTPTRIAQRPRRRAMFVEAQVSSMTAASGRSRTDRRTRPAAAHSARTLLLGRLRRLLKRDAVPVEEPPQVVIVLLVRMPRVSSAALISASVTSLSASQFQDRRPVRLDRMRAPIAAESLGPCINQP